MRFHILLSFVPVISALDVARYPPSPDLVQRDPDATVATPTSLATTTVAPSPAVDPKAIIPANRSAVEPGTIRVSNLLFEIEKVDERGNDSVTRTVSQIVNVTVTLEAPLDAAPWAICSGSINGTTGQVLCDPTSWGFSFAIPAPAGNLSAWSLTFKHLVFSTPNSTALNTAYVHQATLDIADYFSRLGQPPLIPNYYTVPLPDWCQINRYKAGETETDGVVQTIWRCAQGAKGTVDIAFTSDILRSRDWQGTIASVNGTSTFKPAQADWDTYYQTLVANG